MDTFLLIKDDCCTNLAAWHFGMLRTALAEAFLFSCGRGKISMRTEASADAHPALARCARSICRMRKEILLHAHAFASMLKYYKLMLRTTVKVALPERQYFHKRRLTICGKRSPRPALPARQDVWNAIKSRLSVLQGSDRWRVTSATNQTSNMKHKLLIT
jgi:hypothetical protein